MFELEPATKALRAALAQYRVDHDAGALQPTLLAYARAMRHHGAALPEASDAFRAIFNDAYARDPADVRHDLRRERFVNVMAQVYLKRTGSLRGE